MLGTTLGMMELGEELKEPSGLTLTEEASASAATVVAPSGDGLLACLRVSWAGRAQRLDGGDCAAAV